MVKRIIWTKRAKQSQNEIFEYWNWRIGNTKYSKKLFERFQTNVSRLAFGEKIGRKIAGAENIYFIVVNDYKIYYSSDNETVEIILIWDTRRNPDNLKL